MDINFLQYQPGSLAPITIKGCPVHQVQTYKLLGVHVSHDLSWNTHVEHIVTKASERLYALRLLRKSGVACADLVSIYCDLIRSVLQYAAPVWAALPLYLDNLIESVQRKALRIIFPAVHYNSALYQSGLKTLNERRKEMCTNFISYVRGNGREPICSLLRIPAIVNNPPWLWATVWEYFPVPPQGEHCSSRELYQLQIRVETLELMSTLAMLV